MAKVALKNGDNTITNDPLGTVRYCARDGDVIHIYDDNDPVEGQMATSKFRIVSGLPGTKADYQQYIGNRLESIRTYLPPKLFNVVNAKVYQKLLMTANQKRKPDRFARYKYDEINQKFIDKEAK